MDDQNKSKPGSSIFGAVCQVLFWGFVSVLVSAVFVKAWAATPALEPVRVAFTFDRLPVSQLTMIVYDTCEKKGLVFDSATNKVDEVVTLKTKSMQCSEARLLLAEVLTHAGLVLESRSTFDVVRLAAAPDERAGWKQFIYRPSFRDAVELAGLVRIGVVKGSFAHERRSNQVQMSSSALQQVPETGSNGASLTGKPVDKLVFWGPSSEADAVQTLLARLDVPVPQIELQAGVYEFQRGGSHGSVITALASLFGQKLGLSVTGGAASDGGAALKLTLPSFEAALQVLDTDSRFRYVARPKLLASDGELASFFSGEDLRVVGAVVLDRNGNPIQSKETLSAGVRLEATPRIRGQIVDLSLRQAVSNFVPGSGGSDPAVLKREITSRISMKPGAVYAVGGLQSLRHTDSRRSAFGFRVGDSDQASATEIVLLLTVAQDDTPL